MEEYTLGSKAEQVFVKQNCNLGYTRQEVCHNNDWNQICVKSSHTLSVRNIPLMKLISL